MLDIAPTVDLAEHRTEGRVRSPQPILQRAHRAGYGGAARAGEDGLAGGEDDAGAGEAQGFRGQGEEGGEGKGLCPLEPHQGRSPWNPVDGGGAQEEEGAVAQAGRVAGTAAGELAELGRGRGGCVDGGPLGGLAQGGAIGAVQGGRAVAVLAVHRRHRGTPSAKRPAAERRRHREQMGGKGFPVGGKSADPPHAAPVRKNTPVGSVEPQRLLARLRHGHADTARRGDRRGSGWASRQGQLLGNAGGECRASQIEARASKTW